MWPKGKQKEFWKYFAQLFLRAEEDAKMCNGRGDVFIEDFEGFSLKHYASKAALKEAVHLFASLQAAARFNEYGFMVNSELMLKKLFIFHRVNFLKV